MIQFNLQSLKFDWKFPPRRFKISAQVMNHTCDTGDRNLIKMSFEQRGFQNMFVRSSIFLSLCLSWLWITASSRSYGRGQGAIHASGNAINAALIWPITPTMETDPELLRLLITLPFAPLAALLRFFSTPLMAFSELTHGSWKNSTALPCLQGLTTVFHPSPWMLV